jgi:hypothetical protein
MNFKLINKNSIGAIILLLLTIILSQSRFLNFMINTVLGRTLLIIILLVVSSIHKILGIVCVLLIIIIFNNSNFAYLEGMETATQPTTDATNTLSKLVSSNTMNLPNVTSTTTSPMDTSPMDTASTTDATTTETTTTDTTTQSPSVSTPAVVSQTVDSQTTTTPPKKTTTTVAQEGFDIIGKERNIQKGRNSNSIPVSNYMKQSINDEVSPFEWSGFSNNFTIF